MPGAEIIDLGTKRLADLAPLDASRVVHLVTGKAAGPVQRTAEGLDAIVLCGHGEETQDYQAADLNGIKSNCASSRFRCCRDAICAICGVMR